MASRETTQGTISRLYGNALEKIIKLAEARFWDNN